MAYFALPARMQKQSEDEKIAAWLGAAMTRNRKARGWSQETLAERLDVSVDHISSMERGKRLPSVGVLVRLARVFGMTVSELLGESAGEPWVDEALAALRAVSPAARGTVLAMVRGAATAPGEPEDGGHRGRPRKRARF